MPYIKLERRGQIFTDLLTGEEITAGELNYLLTTILLRFVETRGLNYETVNSALGALEGAKLEFYRRVAAPYEDDKCRTNGDVYPQ